MKVQEFWVLAVYNVYDDIIDYVFPKLEASE